MYICNDCKNTFEEPKTKEVDLEVLNGVGGDFPNHHYGTFNICPYCGSDYFDDYDDEEDEDEE